MFLPVQLWLGVWPPAISCKVLDLDVHLLNLGRACIHSAGRTDKYPMAHCLGGEKKKTSPSLGFVG